MSWVRLDDGHHDDPRVLDVPLAAVGLLHLCLVWSCRHLTDGFVSEAFVKQQLVRERDRRLARTLPHELTRVGLWVPTECNGMSGYQLASDLVDLQLSREEVMNRRRLRADAGRLGGLASGRARRHEAKALARAEQSGSKCEARASQQTNPVPSRPVPEKQVSTAAVASEFPSVDREATPDMLDRLFHEVWDAEEDTTSRMDAVKALLVSRKM